jgi:hypothetical protein
MEVRGTFHGVLVAREALPSGQKISPVVLSIACSILFFYTVYTVMLGCDGRIFVVVVFFSLSTLKIHARH